MAKVTRELVEMRPVQVARRVQYEEPLYEDVASLQALVSDLTERLEVLETLLLSIPSERLLGRYSATLGAVQYIRIGTGLDLVGDQLVNTGGGGSSAVSSFILICVDDATEHEITCVLRDGYYDLSPNQAASAGPGAETGKTFTADDATNHVLRLRLFDGYYQLEFVQSAGGSSPITSLLMTADDATTREVVCVLREGYYTWLIN